MAIFSKGDAVEQIVVPFAGEVSGFQIDQESGAVLVLVTRTNEDGSTDSIFFAEDALKAL